MKKKYRLKGWVRRTLSILLVVVLTTALLPDMGSVFVRADGAVVYTQASAPTVDEDNKIIYGNGTPLLLKQEDREENGNTVQYHCIYTYENQTQGILVKEESRTGLEGWTLVGGYADGSYTGDILIQITDGESKISNIYGTDGQNIIGNITINIEFPLDISGRQRQVTSIYGSYNDAFVRGDVTIRYSGGIYYSYCPMKDITAVSGDVDGNVVMDFSNAYLYYVNIADVSDNARIITGNVNISTDTAFFSYFDAGKFSAKNVEYDYKGSTIKNLNTKASSITADSVSITGTGVGGSEVYFLNNATVSGNVTVDLSKLNCSWFFGVSSCTVGGNVDLTIKKSRIYPMDYRDPYYRSRFVLVPSAVQGNVNISLEDIDASDTGLGIGAADRLNIKGVAGNFTTKISGTNSFDSIQSWVETGENTLYLSGELSVDYGIILSGFTDKRVHVENLTVENPITLRYTDGEGTDGRIVAVNEADDSSIVSDFTVTDALGAKNYDTIQLDNEVLISLKSQNTITAVAGEHGSVTPEGAVDYTKGDSAVYTIQPDKGYVVADVLVDGESIGVVNQYTFERILADHSIEAVFEETSVDGIEVLTQPDTLDYMEGDSLNLTGTTVRLSYNDGSTVDCAFEDFGKYGVTTDYQHLSEVSYEQNGQPVQISCNGYTAQTNALNITQKTYTIEISPGQVDFGTVEEGYGQERQAAGKQIQILNTGNQTVTVKAGSAEGYVVGIPEKSELAPGETTEMTVAPQEGLSPADYTAVLTVSTDHDTQAQTELKFVVEADTNPPEGSITISDMTWNKWLNQITFGKFFNKTQKVEITAYDTGTGIANIVYYVAEGEQSVEQLNALPNGKWNLYEKEFTVEPDGRMVVYAKITDKAGNAVYISSNGLVLDATPPEITGIEDAGVYTDTDENFVKTFTVSDDNLDFVSIDGVVTEPEDGVYTIYPKKGVQAVLAKDKAGNTAMANVQVYVQKITQPPVFIGIRDGGVYCENVQFTVEDDNLEKVFAGDTLLTADNGVYTIQGSNQPVKVTAVDADDNRVEVMIQVNTEHTWQISGIKKTADCTEPGIADTVCSICNTQGTTELLPLGHDFSQDWTVDIEPTAKTAGEKSHHCSRCDSRRDIMKIPATGVGTVKVVLAADEGIPAMSIENSTDSMAKNVLTQEETGLLSQGIDIYITVTVKKKEDVSEAQQAQAEEWFAGQSENSGVAGYYDISMTKRIGDGEEVPVTQTLAKLILKMDYPDESNKAEGTARAYQMLLLKEDGAQELVTVQEEDGKIRFATDSFGTAALVYQDLKVLAEAQPEQPQSAPVQTGDRTPVTWLFALLALSGTGIVGSKAKKKSKVME